MRSRVGLYKGLSCQIDGRLHHASFWDKGKDLVVDNRHRRLLQTASQGASLGTLDDTRNDDLGIQVFDIWIALGHEIGTKVLNGVLDGRLRGRVQPGNTIQSNRKTTGFD